LQDARGRSRKKGIVRHLAAQGWPQCLRTSANWSGLLGILLMSARVAVFGGGVSARVAVFGDGVVWWWVVWTASQSSNQQHKWAFCQSGLAGLQDLAASLCCLLESLWGSGGKELPIPISRIYGIIIMKSPYTINIRY
jgi:hypothetical protein